MKKLFANWLTSAALEDDRIILVSGDYCFKMFDELKNKRPKQYLNVGVCEQSMIGFASGLALQGYIPYVYSITPFILERAFEQLKLDLGYQKQHVVCVGYSEYPNDGPTHAELDFEKLVSLLPNFRYAIPRCLASARDSLHQSLNTKSPWFIKLKDAPTWPAEGRDA